MNYRKSWNVPSRCFLMVRKWYIETLETGVGKFKICVFCEGSILIEDTSLSNSRYLEQFHSFSKLIRFSANRNRHVVGHSIWKKTEFFHFSKYPKSLTRTNAESSSRTEGEKRQEVHASTCETSHTALYLEWSPSSLHLQVQAPFSPDSLSNLASSSLPHLHFQGSVTVDFSIWNENFKHQLGVDKEIRLRFTKNPQMKILGDFYQRLWPGVLRVSYVFNYIREFSPTGEVSPTRPEKVVRLHFPICTCRKFRRFFERRCG